MNDFKETLSTVMQMYRGYSEEHRASTQPFHLERAQSNIDAYRYKPDDLLVREPLIEHVGSLPMVATALYPKVAHHDIDLGRALTMLAIHDVGELMTGDEITFSKSEEASEAEREHALTLLPDVLHTVYLEMENNETDTARFAQSVDKITPDIVDLMAPAEATVERFGFFLHAEARDIVPMIRDAKHPYMLWSEFMTDFHLELLDQLDDKLRPYY